MDTLHSTEHQLQQEALKVANLYLQSVKGWKVDDYYLEAIGLKGEAEMSVAIVDGIYLADLNSQQRGSGQSVQLSIDLMRRAVVCELAYQ